MTVILSLDREREVRYNIRAVIEAETVLRASFKDIVGMEGFTVMRGLLWAGLRHEDRKLSLDDVNKMLDTLRDTGRLPEVMPAIRQALIEAKFLGSDEDPNPET